MERCLEAAVAAGAVGRDLGPIHERHPSELAHVDEVEGGAVGERERRAREPLRCGLAKLLEREAAGHAERRAECVATVQRQHDDLPAASHGLDAATREPRGDEPHGLGLGEALPVRRERRDRPAHHERRELARDRLDLG